MASSRISEETLKEICLPFCQKIHQNLTCLNNTDNTNTNNNIITQYLDSNIYNYFILFIVWLTLLYFIWSDLSKLSRNKLTHNHNHNQ